MAGVSAKEPENRPRPARAFSNLALSISGIPLVIESIEEHDTKLPEGTSKREVATTTTYRDSSGRLRIERNVDFGGGSVFLIQIFDYVDGFTTFLDPDSKTAHRLAIPKPEQPPGQPTPRPRFVSIAPLVALSGEKTFKSESLGTQIIEGVEFEGHRTTTTMVDDPSLIGIQEHWRSAELGLIGLTSSSDPDTEESVKIQRSDRKEPDPSLFVIPSDYSVVDLKFPDHDV